MPLALPGRLVLFDYGEVISRTPTEADRSALLRLAGVPEAVFWPAYWADRDRLDHGVLSVRDYWLGIGRASRASWDEGRLHALWVADYRGWLSVDEEVVAVLDELRSGGTRLAVLSNAGADYASLRVAPIAGFFERMFLSAELGLLKPDPAIYRHVAEELGIPADRIVFVDNRAGNVAGAESVGMTGHVFTDAAALRAFLVGLADET